MRTINFTKMVASGNDFVVVGPSARRPVGPLKELAKKICDRKFGVGADGLLVLEKSKIADIKMRIFNPDGSQAEMCGNGARCLALYAKRYTLNAKCRITIETKAGIIESKVSGNNARIKLTEPKNIKLDIPIKINNRSLKVNFINTGVPHVVIFVEGLEKINVVNLGRQIRYHKKFAPAGTNVDFVQILNDNFIKLRTYERGVEDETFACGTGAVASVIISNIKYQKSKMKKKCIMNVETKSGEVLKVYFGKIKDKFKDVWLEGKAKIVHKGEYYV